MNTFNFNMEIKSIESKIKKLDEEKIKLLTEINFKKWNEATKLFEEIALIYINIIKAESHLSIMQNIESDIEVRNKEIEEYTNYINRKKTALKGLLSARDELLKDASIENVNALQQIYIEIIQLQDRIEGINSLINMEYV